VTETMLVQFEGASRHYVALVWAMMLLFALAPVIGVAHGASPGTGRRERQARSTGTAASRRLTAGLVVTASGLAAPLPAGTESQRQRRKEGLRDGADEARRETPAGPSRTTSWRPSHGQVTPERVARHSLLIQSPSFVPWATSRDPRTGSSTAEMLYSLWDDPAWSAKEFATLLRLFKRKDHLPPRYEPPRVCRRLQILRDWSYDESQDIPKVLGRGA
jgi:hypothetical protein